MTWTKRNAVTDDFYVLDDGTKRLRVTRVIGILEKEALAPWSGRLSAEYAWSSRDELSTMDEDSFIDAVRHAAARYTKRAADIGTAVHTHIETCINAYLRGDDYPDLESFPKEYQGHIKGFLAFCAEYEPDWIASEFCVYDGVVMGTCDAAAFVDLRNGNGRVLTVVDFKTGKNIHAAEVSLQLACYRHLPYAMIGGKTMGNLDYEQAAVLHIRPRSTNLYTVEAGQREYMMYRYALELWKHINLNAPKALSERVSIQR